MTNTTRKTLLAAAATLLLVPALSPAVPLWQSQFNTPGATTADDGGFIGGFYGGGDPFFQNDPLIVVTTNNAGSGPDASSCLQGTAAGLAVGANYAFMGLFVQNVEGLNGPDPDPGINISSGSTLDFKLKVGAGAHASFNVKLEDVELTGGGEFNNTTLPISPNPNSSTWTSYSIPLANFLTGGQQVDLTKWGQITFEASTLPLGGTVNFDLLIDDIAIQPGSSVADWQMID